MTRTTLVPATRDDDEHDDNSGPGSGDDDDGGHSGPGGGDDGPGHD